MIFQLARRMKKLSKTRNCKTTDILKHALNVMLCTRFTPENPEKRIVNCG